MKSSLKVPPYAGVEKSIMDSAISLASKEPSFALFLLITNINALLTILKAPIRIQLVTTLP